MKTATITQAKNGLSALIDLVRGGESVVITDRGRPVARMEPVISAADLPGRLRRLERTGAIRIGHAAPPVALIRRPGPGLPDGTTAVDALLDERRTGR